MSGVHRDRLQWIGFWVRDGKTWKYQGTGIAKTEMGEAEFFTRLTAGRRHSYTASHFQENGIPKAIPVVPGDLGRWNAPIGELVMGEQKPGPKLRVVNGGR